ncbi:MAG: NYN domain-containing protein [Planctomycetota bacterium]|jgi:predicted RNA-binding protein with PIN domain
MFIIDGHNLLHTVLKAEEASEATSDLKLCRVVGRYLQLIGRPGSMVFDGAGPPDKSGFDEVGNLEVLFAGRGADADSVIEDKISASTAPKRVTVVSSDRRLRKAARTRKCTSLKSEVFWENVRKQLSRKRPTPEPAAKRHGLSESETDQWLDAFGL